MVCSLVSFSHLMLCFQVDLVFVRIAFKKLLQPGQSFIARSTASKPSQRTHVLLKQERTCLLHSDYIQYLKKKKRINIFQKKRQMKENVHTCCSMHMRYLQTEKHVSFFLHSLWSFFPPANPHGSAPLQSANQHSKNPTCDLTTFNEHGLNSWTVLNTNPRPTQGYFKK